jgi:hypothetical protein
MRVSENRVTRRILHQVEMTGGWRKLHSKGLLNNCYSSLKVNGHGEIEEEEIGGTCGMHGREDSAHKVWYKTLRK